MELRHLLAIAAFILITGSIAAQNNSRPVPRFVPRYQFNRYDTVYHGYYLTAAFKLGPTIPPNAPKHAMILDPNGYLLWYMPEKAQILLDFKYHPENEVFSFINNQSPQDIRFTLLNAALERIDSFTTTNGVSPDLHEFQISRDQTYLLSGIRDSVMDLSNYLFNGVPGSTQTNVIGFVVQEFDAAHQLLFQWNSNDHVHPSQAYDQYGYLPTDFDYSHGNAIEEDVDGGLLLSFRNTNAVYKINRQTGQVEWILGGKSSSFTFSNDPGFSAQHDIRRLPNGNISLFDNANMAQPFKISRAVEYQLDTVNWIATRVWEYRYQPFYFNLAMGGHQTTADRLHLVNFGIGYRPQPSFVLVDDNKQILAEMLLQDSFMTYRSFVFDLPFDPASRPVISCMQDGSQVILTAPPGFEQYEWSTGIGGHEITVQEAGTYQVWVNHGAGMLGSQPIVITDVANGCPVVSGASTPDLLGDSAIRAIYDLLGRRVSNPVAGCLYVVQYKNGLVKRMFWPN